MVESTLHIDNKILLDALTSVSDPEIPVLSIMDMGVVRSVILKDNEVRIDITPTYSGCPAMDTIAADIITAVEKLGYQVSVNLVLSPAWTTDWITVRGR
ncbi:MAG: ring-1,2-phenylacetyl-CoA epoxidase subunit PaaD, partial [Limisphaerales bacterium]